MMTSNQHHASLNQSSPKAPARRLTLGLFSDDFVFHIPVAFLRGVNEMARKYDVNLVYVASDALCSPQDYQIQSNIFYDMIGAESVDAVLLASNLIGGFAPAEDLQALYHRYHPLPLVSLGLAIDGIPSVILDNAQGMYAAVSHLIEAHGYRRIAFINGPQAHPDAQERYQAYVKALADHALPLEAKLVLPGDFQMPAGQQAIRILFDQRQCQPKRDVEAIVTANDHMALAAILELQARQIRIPEDIAVVGFDNNPTDRAFTPPLTTVHAAFDEVGRQGVELLMAQLAGKCVPAVVSVPTQLVVRQSCGCATRRESLAVADRSLPEEMRRKIAADPRGALLQLNREIQSPRDIEIWEHALAVLRQHAPTLLATATGEPAAAALSDTWSALSRTAYLTFEDSQYDLLKEHTGRALISTVDLVEITNILATRLPELGIRHCYLALYEDPPPFIHPQSASEWSRLHLAYTPAQRLDLPPTGVRFRSRQLVPRDVLPQDARYTLITVALYFQQEQIGFILFDAGARDESLYPDLQGQISSALQGALLVRRSQERAYELAAAYHEIQILNDQLKDDNVRMHTEMELARQIQTALLPKMEQHVHPDFEIAATMLPAEEVGGDYYDITLDLNGQLWFGIGDVCGHGVTPGLIMMMAQTVHTAITSNYQASAKEVVCMINTVLFKNVHGRLGADHFMTFTTLKYVGDGRFQHAGAHLDLIVYRQQTQHCELIDTKGVWLNFVPDIAYAIHNAEFTVNVGDVLVLYTDGLTEAFNPQGQMLDIQGLTDIVRRHVEEAVETMRDAILADVLAWCDHKRADDMSLVVARRVK